MDLPFELGSIDSSVNLSLNRLSLLHSPMSSRGLFLSQHWPFIVYSYHSSQPTCATWAAVSQSKNFMMLYRTSLSSNISISDSRVGCKKERCNTTVQPLVSSFIFQLRKE
jgi:hypothetical protein